jgi:hypothetical protein
MIFSMTKGSKKSVARAMKCRLDGYQLYAAINRHFADAESRNVFGRTGRLVQLIEQCRCDGRGATLCGQRRLIVATRERAVGDQTHQRPLQPIRASTIVQSRQFVGGGQLLLAEPYPFGAM